MILGKGWKEQQQQQQEEQEEQEQEDQWLLGRRRSFGSLRLQKQC